MKHLVFFSLIFLLSIAGSAQESFLLKNQFTKSDYVNYHNILANSKEIKMSSDSTVQAQWSKSNDCMDEIDRLEDIIKVYKKIHLDCYYGNDLTPSKLANMNRLGKKIFDYKESSEEWDFWCIAASALIFIDVVDFLDKYPLNCID